MTTRDHSGATLLGDPHSASPLIICFHGSGDSCASWAPLAETLSATHHRRVLLWDRGEQNPGPRAAVPEMLDHLARARLAPPYVLIAHSYGGMFAREFLRQRPHQVAGMVMVETGQETALDPRVEEQQYRKQVLGDGPLSVIRGNTLIWKWKQYEEAFSAAQTDSEKANLAMQKQLLEATDKEDERLKKEQLKLSRNNRYVHVPDCGHGVVQERPEVVVKEVQWVMDNIQITKKHSGLNKSIFTFWSKS